MRTIAPIALPFVVVTGGGCHPPGGNDPGSRVSPSTLARGVEPGRTSVSAAAIASVAPEPYPEPSTDGSTCVTVEAVGMNAALEMLGASEPGSPFRDTTGRTAEVAAGQCLAGQRLEQLLPLPPNCCLSLRVAALAPIGEVEIVVEAHPGAPFETVRLVTAHPEGVVRLPTAGCLRNPGDRALVVRVAATVSDGGGVLALRAVTTTSP
ncbi:MAG: hypothetical protein JW751_21820 [Polyangiaceae bacterium]|nr:hypothetical protein [Polyangiaceae bacterium]